MVKVSRSLRIGLFTTGLAMATSGCSSIDRLRTIGEAPPLTAVDNPTAAPGYKPVQMPMPMPQPAAYSPNSLWRNGSRAFFKDQRAHEVGDILTITVNINDTATFANQTQRSRTNSEDSGVTNFLGMKNLPITNQALPARVLTTDGTTTMDGKGS